MSQKSARGSDIRTESVIARLALEISKQTLGPRRFDLDTYLEKLTKIIITLPEIQGALLVAFDEEGLPVAKGCSSLSFRHSFDIPAQSELGQKSLQERNVEWLDIDAGHFEEGNYSSVLMRPLVTDSLLGLLVVSGDFNGQCASLDVLVKLTDHITWFIQEILYHETFACMKSLRDITSYEAQRSEPELDRIVRELARTFRADAVTLFMEEQGRLRLCESTDKILMKKAKETSYRAREGLTGHVYRTNEPLRLRNAEDHDELLSKGIHHAKPLHSERDEAGQHTMQFLGVPLRCGGQIRGVLRMSRGIDTVLFSSYDEDALMIFANYLGLYFARFWESLLNESILNSDSEAIAISRRELDENNRVFPKIILANRAATELFDRGSLIGLDARELYSPEDYEVVERFLLSTIKNRPHSKKLNPICYTKNNGEVRLVDVVYMELSNPLVRPESKYIIGMMRDITEQRRKEEQHKGLLQMLGAKRLAYFRADSRGRTIESTATDSLLTGYTDDALRTSRIQLYEDPRERERVTHLVKKGHREGKQVVRVMRELRRKDGTSFLAAGDLRMWTDERGNEMGLEGLYEDVTDRISLQGFVDAATDRVLREHELLEKLKAHAAFHLDYMSILSHQLLTPLSSLVENLRNFQEGVISRKDIDGYLPYIIGQGVVCTRLVRNLSYIDQILTAGRFPKSVARLAKLSIETKIDFRHLLREKNLELHINTDGLDRHLVIQCHQEMMRQVIMNLIDNAIKYSFDNSVIEIRGDGSARGRVFEISSHGLPVSEKHREEIFKRGFRTPRSRMQVPDGTGMGLWLVRKILHAHEAEIECDEIVKSGQRRTVFRIIFPEHLGV